MNLEWNSLILGLTLALGAFALKSGIGQFFYLTKITQVSLRISFYLFGLISYLLVFSFVLFLLKTINFLTYLSYFQHFFELGATIHVIFAVGMFFWGIILVKSPSSPSESSPNLTVKLKGLVPLILLVLPCPVCVTAIFITCAFLIAVFPNHQYSSILLAFLVFTVINSATIVILGFVRTKKNLHLETLVGKIMIFIAVYFFLTTLVIPQAQNIDKIYRIALYSGDKTIITPHAPLLTGTIITIFSIGFIKTFLTIRRTKQ